MEEQVKALEEKYTNNEDPVRLVQKDILQDLYAIRECLASPEEELSAELKSLKEENTKLKYRIDHLKRHVSEENQKEMAEEESKVEVKADSKSQTVTPFNIDAGDTGVDYEALI